MCVVPCGCTWKVSVNDFLARRGGGGHSFPAPLALPGLDYHPGSVCVCTYVIRDPPEEQEHSLGERLEVVVPIDLCGVIQGDLSKHLKKEAFRDQRRTARASPATV